MKMGVTYEGVIVYLPPNGHRASVLVQQTTLMGFLEIPAGRTLALQEAVLVRLALPDVARAGATALRLELV